jgi:hypothetical protein
VENTPQGNEESIGIGEALLQWYDEKTGGELRKAVEAAGAEFAFSEVRLRLDGTVKPGLFAVDAWVDGKLAYRMGYAAIRQDIPNPDFSHWTFYADAPAEGVS